VVSRYLGCDEAAWLIAQLDYAEATERKHKASAERADRHAYAEMDKAVAEHGRFVRAIMAGVLLASGYYLHKRQWRKRQ
jgi:hypothetical protein